MSNDYSTIWFDTFLSPIPPEQTAREIDFLARSLVQPKYTNILDVCCGMGRHARALSQRGYQVTGLDTNEYALEQARRADPLTRYLHGDMRALDALNENFDAVLILWQSFGNFDAATNEKILEHIARILKPYGRFVLDIYNRQFFETRPGERRIETPGRVVVENKAMEQNRLRVELDYGALCDVFEWQVFYPDELAALGTRFGLNEIVRCTNFDPLQLPNADMPRMQFVFEKPVYTVP
jgi:SAM-dependent methyltransferase